MHRSRSFDSARSLVGPSPFPIIVRMRRHKPSFLCTVPIQANHCCTGGVALLNDVGTRQLRGTLQSPIAQNVWDAPHPLDASPDLNVAQAHALIAIHKRNRRPIMALSPGAAAPVSLCADFAPTATPADRSPLSDEDLAEMAAVDFAPAFTSADVDEKEKTYETDWRVDRRVMLLMLTRTRQQLIDFASESDEGMDATLEAIKRLTVYRDHLNAMRELCEAAMARLFCAAANATLGATA